MSNVLLPSPLLRGEIIELTPADPAAGALFDYQLPAFYNYELLFLKFQFLCSAAVASRYAFWELFTVAGASYARAQAYYPQLTNQTRNYYCAQISNYNAAVYPNTLQLPLPIANVLLPLSSIGITIDSIDAGDQIHDVQMILLRHALPGA